MNYFIPPIEKMPVSRIKKFQETQLRDTLLYLRQRSPFYQRMFRQMDIQINQIRYIEDLASLPVTTKQDLQLYNDDFLCVSRREIVDYVNTSGTLGTPVTFALTEKDLQRLAYNEYLSLSCANGTSDDVYQLTTTMDKRFMAGLAYFMGCRMLKAGIIRVGSGMPEMQWDTIMRLKPTALIGVPSFLLKLVEYAEDKHIDYQASSINKLVCIGENIRKMDFSLNNLGQRIFEKWGLPMYSTYASTEMGTSFTECEEGRGGHHHPELLIVEILDEYGCPVPDGQPGELAITNLGVEGMPLLRFKTGDICIAHTEACDCGRTTTRLSPIIGRTQQMLKYKGTTLYPQSIYDALNKVDAVKNYVVESYTNEIGTDEIRILVGCYEATDQLKSYLKEYLRSKLRVSPVLEFREVADIQRMQFPENSRKPITFIDNRIKEVLAQAFAI